jgi:hypothetical protein
MWPLAAHPVLVLNINAIYYFFRKQTNNFKIIIDTSFPPPKGTLDN